MPTDKDQDDIIDLVIRYLYNNGNYRQARIEAILAELNIEMNDRDITILVDKMSEKSLAYLLAFDELPNWRSNVLRLLDAGIEIYNKYGSYQRYLGKQKKSALLSRGKSYLKSGLKYLNILATIILTLVTAFFSIQSRSDQQELRKQEKEILRLTKQNDSLKASRLNYKPQQPKQ